METAPLHFYITPPEPCPYLPDRQMMSVFADPRAEMDTGVYGQLAQAGFRRSGRHVYRHQCPGCNACVAVRVPVERFRPNRAQRRVWRRNKDLTVHCAPAAPREEHFDLYRRYVDTRHAGGGMDNPSPREYWRFISSEWSDTDLVEFRAGDRLVCVAVCDRLPDGLSAVYTYFDPEESGRSPGTHAILWQIAEARRLGLPHVYLGYWIAESPKMAYKADFRPAEGLRDGIWDTL
ncbi:arginyltransferase [Thioalkalivibrio denitrificans]|uniref:arginyltransferase n=1 Tax=Thioalkalivibrio denitrificans TaxID=108003 RepID=UPI001C3772A5|nr:arginyltransferase [Thioalkalivibrio denitrificans]